MIRALLFAFILCMAVTAKAGEGGMSLIRDAESEALIREIARPIFLEAGLVPENIHLYIMNSPELNAFVAGGQNMFLSTGILTWSNDPYVVAGVMAHESGHIAGGHLVRTKEDLSGMNIGTIMSYVLGAATIAAGSPEAGAAILSGGSHIAESMALSYSREKEQAADQVAANVMTKLGLSLEGLVKLLQELNSQQHRQFEDVNPYAQTHPPSAERIQFLQNVMTQAHLQAEAPKELRERYARMVAKINAFIGNPEEVKRHFLPTDTSDPAILTRAVLAHRAGDVKTAIAEMDKLLVEHPDDGFLYELKGQILYEQGMIQDSIAAYERAVALQPKEPLIQLGLGVAYLSRGEYLKAINTLKTVTQAEKEDSIAWRQLGIAYGKAGDMVHSYVALAEEAMVRHNKKDAKRFIALAKPLVEKDTSAALRLGDMERELKAWKEDEKSSE